MYRVLSKSFKLKVYHCLVHIISMLNCCLTKSGLMLALPLPLLLFILDIKKLLSKLQTIPVPFQSCSNFSLEFLQKLFIWMRIYYGLKFANRDFSTPCKKKNRKYIKVTKSITLYIFSTYINYKTDLNFEPLKRQRIKNRRANHLYLQLVAELRRTQINMAAAFEAQERSITITLYSYGSRAQEQSPRQSLIQILTMCNCMSLTLDCSNEREHTPPMLPKIILVKLYSINLSFKPLFSSLTERMTIIQ